MTFDPPFSSREKQSLLIFVAGVLLFIVENIHYGWHRTPTSPLEGACDFLAMCLLLLSYLWKPSRVENTDIKHETNMFFGVDGRPKGSIKKVFSIKP